MTEDRRPQNQESKGTFPHKVDDAGDAKSSLPSSSTDTYCGPESRPLLPEKIGQYHIKRIIAGGGMGTVYEAVQEHPRRSVALKVMKPEVVSRSALRRFEHESQILGRLRHPGIAQVYEAGTYAGSAGPVPYFAMEYIPNAKPLTRYADEKKLGTRQRLELFTSLCEAVDHGHKKGIIHRDLKPGNILVDPQGQLKIIDFGVARSTDSDMAVTTLQTDVGQLLGTLKYMSPEQCEADPDAIDLRSDVYALGVVLYELLTGKLPYDLYNTPIYEAPRVIREVAPTRLSSLNKTLRGDVETIVIKALEKDRDRRYPSAIALAEDIRRYLRNEPIIARPPSAVYRLRKLVRRRRVSLSATALLVVASGLAVYFHGQSRAAAVARAGAETIVNELFQKQEGLLEVFSFNDEQLKEARQGPLAKAIADCNRAIELDPRLAAPYAFRGKLFQLNRETSRAWADCVRALEINPNDSLALRTSGFLMLERGNFKGALSSYNRGIRGTEGLPEDFHNRATLLEMSGEYRSALTDRDRAVELRPQEGTLFVGRGITRRFLDDVEGAIVDFGHGARLDSTWGVQCNLWIWEMRMLRNDPSDRGLAEDALSYAQAAAVDLSDKTNVGICRGELSAGEAMAKLTDNRTRGYGYYYLGAKALVDGRVTDAEALFQRCRDANWAASPEFNVAGWHLNRLRGQ